MRNNALIATIFTLLALTATLVVAQPPGDRGQGSDRHGGPGDRLAELDTNGDGEISRAEYEAVDHFARHDRNGDGVLNQDDRPSRDEMRSRGRHRGPSPGAMVGMMLALGADADENRVTTESEWDAHVYAMDLDGNGELDLAEWTAALAPPEDARRGGLNEERFAHMIERLDTNENGVIDVAEVESVFAKLDDDGDGEVKLERPRRRGPRHRGRG